MWVLDLNDEDGVSYGMYLMDFDFAQKDKVVACVQSIIEGFNAPEDDDWDALDISLALNTRGYKNQSIECLRINI